MKKEQLTFVITGSLIIILLMLFVAMLIKNGDLQLSAFHKENMDKNISSSENVSTSGKNSEDNRINYQIARLEEGASHNFRLPSRDKYNNGAYDTAYIEFVSVSFGKEKGNFDSFDDWNEIKNNNGKILNEYQYAVATVKIKIKSSQKRDFALNCFYLSVGESMYKEIRSYLSGKEKRTKDYYVVSLEPEEEYYFELAYVVPDSSVYSESRTLDVTLSGLFFNNCPIIAKNGEIKWEKS